ncbi:cyclic nucleotide gated channel, plant [Marchantia polymorpha subsp. ruderalis]|uniref:Cyclic nucleotide-binding domain-containing protein n=1 Tax=Marchantia polymorpha subsp. ruderalis TaxID=1480154 RepID=A0AAF6BMK5_MARPO|nr:hypothetical protein Mp_6g01920 [Marchantia polymorpha subsp. ruderalis]
MNHGHGNGPIKVQNMQGQNRKFVRFDFISPPRFNNETESDKGSEASLAFHKSFSLERTTSSVKKSWERSSNGLKSLGRSLKSGVSRVFAEDYHNDPLKKLVLDPRNDFVQKWNRFFVVSCLVAVFVDPLFFYLPVIVDNDICIRIEWKLAIAVTVLRTTTDTLYLLHMALQFRTAYIAPSSRVFGRGELVTDPQQIARRYLKKDFWLDLVAVLPLPQVVIWVFIPLLKGTTAANTKNALRFIVFIQYLPRLFRIFPLTSQMVKTTGIVMETAWAGAAYNLLLYMLASHVVGACWYLLAIERQDTCWRDACPLDTNCVLSYFDCGSRSNGLSAARSAWRSTTNVTQLCTSATENGPFNYGLFNLALSNKITSSVKFVDKYFYCLWFGLLNLSSLGQSMTPVASVGETLFAIIIIVVGLSLFGRLIGNMQTYLQSLTVRLEEMRVKRRDTEQWMRHRQLPAELKDRVRRYDQYKWVATRGVDEGLLLQSLPLDLRRDIKRHLCLDYVRRVPLFDQMDDRLLDAICERLKPALNTEQTYIVREGDPVNEMLFIIRGHLESVTTNGGRTGFFNFGALKPGDFCGEELLTWALDPRPSKTLPSSTRTVKALVEVEAFALQAEDLKFVASQFRRLHSKQLQHTFRYYSHQWRTWAACFIQARWRRYQRRKLLEIRRQQDEYSLQEAMSVQDRSGSMSPSLAATFYASRFAANAMRGVQRMRSMHAAEMSTHIPDIPKPSEPDFTVEDD